MYGAPLVATRRLQPHPLVSAKKEVVDHAPHASVQL
jgi:hypothetical protein